MIVTARFKVDHVITYPGGHIDVVATPVYSNDPMSPNHSYTKSTPRGKLELSISAGMPAQELFVPGAVLDIAITHQAQ